MRLVKHALISFAAGASLAVSSAAQADITCSFSISELSIDTSGNVVGLFANSGTVYTWYLCALQGSVSVSNNYGNQTVVSGACNGIYSQLLTARAAGQPINISWHGPTACTAAQLPASGNTSFISPYPTYWGF